MKKWNLNRNLSLLPNIVTSNLPLLVYILLQIYIFISILCTYLYFNIEIFHKYRKKNYFLINFGNYHLHCKSFLRHVDTKRRIRWYPAVDRVDMCFPSP